MRLAVVGSRDFPGLGRIDAYLDCVNGDLGLELDCIISDGARGVDSRAEGWAMRNGIALVSFRPEKASVSGGGRWEVRRAVWPSRSKQYDKAVVTVLPGSYPTFAAAAFVRNRFIADFSDAVVAFWDGKSRGTKDTIAKARSLGNLRDIIRG